jgi:arylsulfatase A-like enzyme
MPRIEALEIGQGRSRPTQGYLASACWLGLMMGLVELGLLLIDNLRNHVSMIGALQLNRHYPWMIPASHLAIFAACGLALELIRRILPGLGRRLAPLALGALAFLSFLLAIRELDTIACVLLAGGLASQVVPRLRRFAPAFQRVVGVSLPVLLVAMVLMVVGRHAHFEILERRAEAKPIAKGSPNVLFLVLDTVRAKSLGLYGYPRDTTPRLAGLASRGVRFTEARSAAPWTLPSHATMFTGMWPSELFEYPEEALDDSYPTLAEFLGENGYATAGFVANTYYCNAGYGLARGFDHYEDFYETFDTTPSEVLRHSVIGRRVVEMIGDVETIRPDGRKDADRINRDFLEWLSTRRGRPFFAFLNYFDAHAPYLPPPAADRHFGLRPVTPADNQALASWQKLTGPPDDPRMIELARDAYDDCIAYLDAALGRLFDELDRRGVLEDTLVVLTSDHGEAIGEHQLFGHGRSLYREELHVPLVVVKPGRVPSGKVVTEPVGLRDLPATIVELLGLSDRSPFPGRSLASLWANETGVVSPGAGVVRSEVTLRLKATTKKDRPPALRGPMTSIVSEGMSYIRNADGTEELYRLADDPAELKNLAESEAARPALGRLRALAHRKATPSSEVTVPEAP